MGAFEQLRNGQIDHGYFGNHSSSIDWCETNYAVTPYIAEFVNTLTNIPTIILGLWGYNASIRGGLPRRYALGYLGLASIALGSVGFHASLRWEWQLMDELPMFYFVSYMVVIFSDTSPGFSPLGVWRPLAYVAWCTCISLTYLYIPFPMFFHVAFTALILICVGQINRMLLAQRQDLGSSGPNKVTHTFMWALSTFAIGFAVWNIDNHFCGVLRAGREALGPLGFILEGHGYWHFLAGYSAYLGYTCGIYLVLVSKTSAASYDYDSTAWFPVCYRADQPEGAIYLDAKTRRSRKERFGMGVMSSMGL